MSDEESKHQASYTYETGYKRPPKNRQWQRGQSGNPKGRPKRSDDLADIAARVGREKQPITHKGKTRLISLNEAVVRRTYADTINDGAWRAREQVSQWAEAHSARQIGSQEDPEVITFTLKLEDDDPRFDEQGNFKG